MATQFGAGLQLPLAIDLQSPSERRTALVRDVGALIATVLGFEFDASINNHTGSFGQRRSLYSLTVLDGDCQAGSRLFGTTDLHSEQRRIAEEKRQQLEDFYELASGVVEDWHVFVSRLLKIAQLRPASQQIDLRAAVMGKGGKTPERLYFDSFQLSHDVEVGDLANKVHAAILPYARDWVFRMTSVIREKLKLDAFGTRIAEGFDMQADLELLALVQDALVDAIATQVSMSAKRTDAADDSTAYINPRVCTCLLQSVDQQVDLRGHARKSVALCKQRLQQLDRVVYVRGFDAATFSFRGLVAETLRDVPFVLKSRPGFASLCARAKLPALLAALDAAPSAAALATSLADWQASVCCGVRSALHSTIKIAIELTDEQLAFVDSNLFLATAYRHMPVEPGWVQRQETVGAFADAYAARSYERKLRKEPPTNPRRPYLPLSLHMELAVRLLSVVGEICGDADMFEAYFGAGKVSARILKPIFLKANIDMAYAVAALDKLRHETSFGVNYRNATRKLESWRGSGREGAIRDAISKVARWPLHEIASVLSDRSPLYSSTAPLVLAETAMVMGSRMRRAPSIVQRIATLVLPFLIDIRSELRLVPTNSSSPLLELLAEVGVIRAFFADGGESPRLRNAGTELVVTHEDLRLARGKVTETLRKLVEHRAVRYGKRRRSDDEFGHKRVFTFAVRDLLALVCRQ